MFATTPEFPGDPSPRISWLAVTSLLCGVAVPLLGLLIWNELTVDYAELLLLSFALCAVLALVFFVLTRLIDGRRYLRPRGMALATVGALSALVFGLGFSVADSQRLQERAPRYLSQNNLRQLGIAMHYYAGTHGNRMPPAASRDKVGRPLLSWRVLILPYLEESSLYDAFNLDEPWDSPHNRKLLSHMPQVYRTPAGAPARSQPGMTFYQVFTGPDTPFEFAEGSRLPEDFRKGTANTILIVEASEAVPWTKPQDLEYDPDGPLPRLGGIFDNPGRVHIWPRDPQQVLANVALADGSARSLNRALPEKAWRWAISRTTTEPQPPEW